MNEYLDYLSTVARVAWDAGLVWQALGIIFVGVLLWKLGKGLKLGALLTRWHEATKDGTGPPDPDRPPGVGRAPPVELPPGGAPLRQSPPDDYL